MAWHTGGLGIAAYLVSLFENLASKYLAVAAMLAFIVTLVAGMHEVDDGLKVKSVTKVAFTLTGVSQQFAGDVSQPSRITPQESQS